MEALPQLILRQQSCGLLTERTQALEHWRPGRVDYGHGKVPGAETL